jgi:hypothetical protein
LNDHLVLELEPEFPPDLDRQGDLSFGLTLRVSVRDVLVTP